MKLTLETIPERYAVCRFPQDSNIPSWITGPFYSLTRTPDELSVVSLQSTVPSNVQAERDWRVLRIAGQLDFSLIGVIANLSNLLAAANVSIFVVSTFDTDYFLVRESELAQAAAALTQAGHTVQSFTQGK